MYVRIGKLLPRCIICLFSSHQVSNRQSQMNSLVPTLPSTRRAYATHPYAQYCCGSLCLSKPAVRISPSASAGTSFFFILRHTYKARLVYICNTTSLFAASSVYSCVRSNNATAPGVLGTLRQQLKQATYYAHRADARCTLSSTAKMFFVVVGIGKYMRIRTCCFLCVTGIYCSVPIISGSCAFATNRSYEHRI